MYTFATRRKKISEYLVLPAFIVLTVILGLPKYAHAEEPSCADVFVKMESALPHNTSTTTQDPLQDPRIVGQTFKEKNGSTNFFRYLYGDAVTILEKNIQRAVVAFDSFLSAENTNSAKRVELEVNPILKSDFEYARVVDIQTLWYAVEYAQIRMTTAEKRMQLLDTLIESHPEKSSELRKIKKTEQEIYLEQMRVFANYFKPYERLRMHLKSILKKVQPTTENPTCNSGACHITAQWFVDEVGINDRQLLSIAKIEDPFFINAVLHSGVASVGQIPQYFNDILTAAKAAQKTELASDPEPTQQSDETLTLSQTEPTSASAVDLATMVERSIEPKIQMWATLKENRIEIMKIYQKIITTPWVAKIIFGVVGKYLPGLTNALVESKLTSWIFDRMKAIEMSERYSYEVTRINRNPDMTILQKILELKKLNASGSAVGLDVFEFIARRKDLEGLWVNILNEVTSTSNKSPFYADLVKNITDLEAERVANTMSPIAAIYHVGPIDYFCRVTFSLASAILSAYYGIHVAGLF